MVTATREAKLLASLVLEAAKVREASYVNSTYYEDTGAVSVYGHYKVDTQEAAEQVCSKAGQPSLAMPVYLALRFTSDDIRDWATEVDAAQGDAK